MAKSFVRKTALFAVTALTASVPVTADAGGLHVQEAACQDGTCCPEDKSTCVVGTHAETGYYFKPQGSCKNIDQT
jgi:hypothetical protein